jgi:ATP-dependent DNA helicase RecG
MLDEPVSSLLFVGPKYKKRLQKLGIKTVGDLLFHFPHRYQDLTSTTIKGTVLSIKNVYTKYGKRIQEAEVFDGQSKLKVIWFNQPFLVNTLPAGTKVALAGKTEFQGTKKVLVAPEYEIIKDKEDKKQNLIHTGRLVPVYPETAGISSRWLRLRIAKLLPSINIEDFLPPEIQAKYNLLSLKDALCKIHFPENKTEAEAARRRLAFDELFKVQLIALLRRQNWKKSSASYKLLVSDKKVSEFIESLPFTLTFSQKKAIDEILEDLKKNQPMNRLLQGDVGSGKTVVAAVACYVSFLNGLQSAIMAPTQILAQQHYNTLKTILEPFGAKIALLIHGKNKLKREEIDKTDIIVGTQALIQKQISFSRLALAVIDEQHRFGVVQRALLTKKGNQMFAPHVLTMTATPIPRTVALVLYGDLDLSVLNELPKGRIPIKTWVVPPQKRNNAYEWIRKKIKEGKQQNECQQAFIVCPLIEESEKESMKSVRAAKAEFERLSKEVFPDLRLSLLHGRLKAKEKEEIMDKVRQGKIDILVATPVVEVGVDLPNATIMMIEAAERFGLAQLHQLRGRVGRGNKQSYCLLFTESRSQITLSRLKALEKTLSGSQLAELDLKLRGPGDIFGTAQHGFPDFKIASWTDTELIKNAREAAEEVLAKIDSYKTLQSLLKKEEMVAAN